MNKITAETNNLLTVPAQVGRAIIEAGAAISCPLLGTDKFVKLCKDCGSSINRDRIHRLERLGLFAPVFRVREPDENVEALSIPPEKKNNWFEKGWAWDTTGVGDAHQIPDPKDRSQEGYYSIFQIDHLGIVLSGMTLSVQLDSYIEPLANEKIEWEKNGERWLQLTKGHAESLQSHEFRRAISLLCQFVSNRYYPQTQGDQRTIQVPLAPQMRFDQWTKIFAEDWDWQELARKWDPGEVERLFELTPEKLRHAYQGLAVTQAHCDPLEKWHQLVQFVKVSERQKLKGDALRAETLRSGAHMLRLLYKDLYGHELPHPNEVTGTIITHVPELETRADTRRYLEFVVNRYGLNPQPKVCLIVEGPSEDIAVTKIFDEYFGAHPGKYGIEIIPLSGVDFATGGKADRFRAILRLIDYLHHHQTITFLILDNEGYAHRLKAAARKAKSIHYPKRHVTRPEYIRIWKTCFEFENFSCTEIATAMSELAGHKVTFSRAELAACKRTRNPGAAMETFYKQKAGSGLKKTKLSESLVQAMLSGQSGRKIKNRPIVKALERVARLATMNPFPTMQEVWEKNQASKYLGKIRH